MEKTKELEELEKKIKKLEEIKEFEAWKKGKGKPQKIDLPPLPEFETKEKKQTRGGDSKFKAGVEYLPTKTCATEVINIYNTQRYLLIGAIVTPFLVMIANTFNFMAGAVVTLVSTVVFGVFLSKGTIRTKEIKLKYNV